MTDAEIRMARVIIDGMRMQVMHGNPLSLEQQRALLGHVDKLQKQAAVNLDRLVMAREKFDALIRGEKKPTIELMLELGSTLGRPA